MKTILVTGGAGFIGSALIRLLIQTTNYQVVNIDKLTYAGNLANLHNVKDHPRYHFEQLDICDKQGIAKVFDTYKPMGMLHLAAESHVDRSIEGSNAFLQTNVVGTHTLLEGARTYISKTSNAFRFHHVSTDEVFGSLGETGAFKETTPYDPRSPYSSTKAASDHLVQAWHHTYGLDVVLSNCSNNYGPYQFPEKLVPVVILKALAGETIPIYGEGKNVRDWLYVKDHARALLTIFEKGKSGESYNVGGNSERTSLDIANYICKILDESKPNPHKNSYSSQINFVKDRPGHDFRYAIDASKLERELGWQAEESFESGMTKTVNWYLNNQEWCENILSGDYTLKRLGLATR